MKRILSLCIAALLLLSLAACANAAAPAQESAKPVSEATAAPTATPEPTSEPTPSPTPEPAFIETPLTQALFSRNNVAADVTGIRFSANYEAYADLSITNSSAVPVTISQDGIFINNWSVDGVVENGEAIAPGETRAASVVVNWVDDPNAVYMNISQVSSFLCNLVVSNADTGEEIYEHRALSVAIPDAAAPADPTQGAEALYEDENFAVYLQGIDDTLQHVRVILYKQPDAKWKSATVDPVYAGYTNLVNNTYPLEQGTYRLFYLDASDVMAAQNITDLHEMQLYVSLNYFDGRLDRPKIITITDPNVAETKLNAPDPGPIVYQSKLAYCVLRNMGVIQFQGHEAILLDYENVTQNYIKLLDLTAFPISPLINIDGTDYTLGLYCTYSFPNTHGYIMLWPEDAPEGTLSNAGSATVRINITRIHAGHFDPIQDTGMFTIDLKAK
ncbi:MAG: hypothetical protein LLF75_12595 [Eubacteriales bacterium]|nr:hypothetical protein [Eubacteriales bacterium]